LGGEIWVTSELDVGTTFSFTLPLDVNQADPLANGEPQPERVLLIEDNEAVVNLLKPQLENAGYQVIVANTEKSTLNLVGQMQSSPKLIILDLLIKNIDSFSLLEQLEQDEKTNKVPVLISCLAVDESGQDLSLDVIDYLTTSFGNSEVLRRVRSAITIATGETQDIGPRAKVNSSRNGQYQILVVDDNQSTIEWLKNILDTGGYQVQRAFNGKQALDVVTGTKPDLVLIDLKMPDVDGASIISQVCRGAAPNRIPIIVITDHPVHLENNRVKVLGREDWAKMKHPFVTDALVAEIVRVGDKAGASDIKKTIKF